MAQGDSEEGSARASGRHQSYSPFPADYGSRAKAGEDAYDKVLPTTSVNLRQNSSLVPLFCRLWESIQGRKGHKVVDLALLPTAKVN